MTGIDDEMLSAYLDGELDAGTRERVEAALADDAGLRRRLEQLRRNDDLLCAAFDEVENTPVPERLQAAARPPAAVIPLWRRVQAPALAAAAALVLGLALGRLLAPSAPEASPLAAGPVPVDSALAAALAATPSGEVARAGTLEIAPLVTFRTDDGRLCREYQAREAGEAVTVAVACSESGQWRNIALAGGAAGTSYRQASAGDGLRALIGAGDARTLNAAEEQAALDNLGHGGHD
ncbi:anti-sigma factor family protein [Spiribacter halobius]|uniref:Putative zinc-finger domain-containing protein n=1 Tax=Sediminicurvatus halobius TaxID=2182432 RepID=A0A2U2MYE1_9GAMM|nr:zf-HC2 domain-containing protein [Spiribacter halobius]PWG62021.1 hypothetical protein DEM34_13630 [Spiribacter halobius]UEX78718.1 zf-HC2 domain-containing protein [Spiribacter halobius]